MNEYLTVNEAMSILKVSRLSIYRYIAAGSLVSYRIGRLVRITRGDLEDFVNRGLRRRPVKSKSN